MTIQTWTGARATGKLHPAGNRDHAGPLQSLDTGQHRGAGQANLTAKVGHGRPAVRGQQIEQLPVQPVQLTIRRRHGGHGDTPPSYLDGRTPVPRPASQEN